MLSIEKQIAELNSKIEQLQQDLKAKQNNTVKPKRVIIERRGSKQVSFQ